MQAVLILLPSSIFVVWRFPMVMVTSGSYFSVDLWVETSMWFLMENLPMGLVIGKT